MRTSLFSTPRDPQVSGPEILRQADGERMVSVGMEVITSLWVWGLTGGNRTLLAQLYNLPEVTPVGQIGPEGEAGPAGVYRGMFHGHRVWSRCICLPW